jgi:hypothetical protein
MLLHEPQGCRRQVVPGDDPSEKPAHMALKLPVLKYSVITLGGELAGR